jgi:hypothetical protein
LKADGMAAWDAPPNAGAYGAALSSSGRRLATTTNELWRITEGYRKPSSELPP